MHKFVKVLIKIYIYCKERMKHMKCKSIKTSIKKFLVGTLGVLIFLSSSNIAKAATADQVTLSVARPGAGYVNTVSDPLRVRESPSTSSNVITSLPRGSKIMIVERCNGFYKVQYDTSGHYGYVSSQYVGEYDLDYYCTANTSGTLNMRSGVGTSYGIVASIPSQKNFPVLLVLGDWDYALYGNTDGYVCTDYTIRHHY